MKKRMLAMVMTVMMALSLLPVGAMAADITKLGTPTELTWGRDYEGPNRGEEGYRAVPGMISWKTASPNQNKAKISIYRQGTTEPVMSGEWDFGSENRNEYMSVDDFILEDLDSGTYYFTVQSLGDGTAYSDSDVATSDLWTYTKVSEQLPVIPQGTWEWPNAKWMALHNDDAYYYDVRFLFSETLGEEPLEIGSCFRIFEEYGTNCDIENEYIHDSGNGYYYFQVRAVSKDITKIQNGPWSELSAAYNLGATSGNVHDALLAIQATEPDQIRSAVQALDTDKLKTAMLADQNGDTVVKTLQDLEEKVGGRAEVSVAEGFSDFDQDKISIVGANLNTVEGDGATLNVGAPENTNDVIPEAYDNTVAVKFSMDLDGVAYAEELAVPVEITLPIPSRINPEFLVVLHYPRNGGEPEEVIMPHVYEQDGQWYAKFVLTHFSDFVMTQEIQADAVAQIATQDGIVYYNTLATAIENVATGQTITLLKDVTNGDGIVVSGNRNFVIDFAGHTYNVTQNLAGSAGTETQCFQLLKGSAVTMKNGTIVGDNANVRMMIQNYSDLTLENMILDATQGTNRVSYVLSNNFGNTTITGETQIIAPENAVAFDLWYGMSSSYQNGVSVTFDQDFTGNVKGNIEYGSASPRTENWQDKTTLTIQGGSFESKFIPSTSGASTLENANIVISGGSYSNSVKNFVVDELQAELKKAEGATPYSYYPTITEALAAAKDGDIVTNLSENAVLAEVGFKADGADANAAINKMIKTLGGPETAYVSDCDKNTMWAMIQGTGVSENCTVKVTKDGADVNTSQVSAQNGAVVYFTFEREDHVGDYELASGTYTICLYQDGSNDPIAVTDLNLTEVSYDTAGGTPAVNSVYAMGGDSLKLPSVSKSGYTFQGWKDGAGTYAAGTDYTVPASDVTLTAVWKSDSAGGGGGGGAVAETYTLTFDTNGGSVIDKVTKDKNTTIDLSKYVPTREGYTFDGWYSDKDLTKAVTSVKLTANTTVYAKWTQQEAPAGLPFTDVNTGDWFYNDVKYVYENGMMNGVAPDLFRPVATTTRGMIVTILYRLENEPAVSGESPFTDISAGQWYTDAVNWAAANQVVNGTSPTTFAPNAPITREQMAAILYRYAQFKGYDVTDKADLSKFADAASVSEYAVDALSWANAEGLINGVGQNTLSPKGNAIRAQIAAILARFCENVAK